MCTVIFALERVRDFPLVVAANRDEFYARDTAPPQVLIDAPRTIGGVDLRAGGTWMATSERGYCAGLTNYHSALAPDGARSRGQLVLDLARAGTAADARALLASSDPRRYAGFNAFVASCDGIALGYGRPDQSAVEMQDLGAGVHVLPNGRADAPTYKVERARDLLNGLDGDWDDAVVALRSALGDHALPDQAPPHPLLPPDLALAIQALCVHTRDYGTRSAAIVGFSRADEIRYLHSEGPVCRAPLADYSALLRNP